MIEQLVKFLNMPISIDWFLIALMFFAGGVAFFVRKFV